MDNLTKEQRKRNMQNIKSKDTEIEVLLRKALWKKGYRFRKNYSKLPGKPDIAFTKYKIAIFCDGEFFHGKDWEVLKPKLEKSNNSEYWINKIDRNRKRDHHLLQLRVEQQNDKAITTPASNALLGEYFRNRLGLANGAYVTATDLRSYGRTDVTFIKIDEEHYYMDFSI